MIRKRTTTPCYSYIRVGFLCTPHIAATMQENVLFFLLYLRAVSVGNPANFARVAVGRRRRNKQQVQLNNRSANPLTLQTAWELLASGAEEPTVLTPGDSAAPSDTVVYRVALKDILVFIPVNVTDVGPYALLLEHGTEEANVVLVSPSGTAVVVAVAEDGAADEEGHDHDQEEEEGDEEDHTSPATATQWVKALIASLAVSACR